MLLAGQTHSSLNELDEQCRNYTFRENLSKLIADWGPAPSACPGVAFIYFGWMNESYYLLIRKPPSASTSENALEINGILKGEFCIIQIKVFIIHLCDWITKTTENLFVSSSVLCLLSFIYLKENVHWEMHHDALSMTVWSFWEARVCSGMHWNVCFTEAWIYFA